MNKQTVVLNSGSIVTSSRLREIREVKSFLLEEIQKLECQIQNLEEEEKKLKFRLGFKFR